MTSKLVLFCMTVFLLTALPLWPEGARGEEQKQLIPDKALCAKMLRFGKQAYQRGRYLDAKEYFRKAVQADPESQVAWRYYDMAVIFALAENVEKNANLVLPGVSSRQEGGAGPGPSGPPPPTPSAPSKKEKAPEFKILEDEGC